MTTLSIRLPRRRRSRVLRRIGVPGLLALGYMILLVICAIAAPLIAPHDPLALSDSILTGPSGRNPLGTDNLGRDVLSDIIYGSRLSLGVGFSAALAATLVGTALGAYGGFHGGWVDTVIMRIAELFQVFPPMILAALVVAMLGGSFTNVVVVIALLCWPQTARVARNESMRLKEIDFVQAARTLGLGRIRIVFSEIIPNVLGPVIALGTLIVGEAILLEASLSFLGLGNQGSVSWGQMLNAGWQNIFRGWWLSVFPGCAIFLTVLSMNLLGETFNRWRER